MCTRAKPPRGLGPRTQIGHTFLGAGFSTLSFGERAVISASPRAATSLWEELLSSHVQEPARKSCYQSSCVCDLREQPFLAGSQKMWDCPVKT